MTSFLQLHLLTAYGAANLNRDDTGRPKTLSFGGADRLRISSQSLKRAFRTSPAFIESLPQALGQRSQRFMQALVQDLAARGLTIEDASARAEKVVELAKLGKVKDKGKGSAQTEQLVHLGLEELAAIGALAERLVRAAPETEKDVLVLSDKPRAADIAMFGRMLADNPRYNVEAAVQVAHAFTTHRVLVENDYYTAVDDIKGQDGDADRGAGFIGVQYFGAGLFYLYICADLGLLIDNLAGDRVLAGDTVEALIQAAATVSPSGKQNAFASRAKAIHIVQELGADAPRSLAAAFQTPVEGPDVKSGSVRRLDALRKGFAAVYGEAFDTLTLDPEHPEGATLAELKAAARARVMAL